MKYQVYGDKCKKCIMFFLLLCLYQHIILCGLLLKESFALSGPGIYAKPLKLQLGGKGT